MVNNIRRVNCYNDKRFKKEVLMQHGAFIVDDKLKCSFEIIDKDSAIIVFDKGVNVFDLIDEFRFYSEHICNFYSKEKELIKTFEPQKIFDINISDIQPSQFYINSSKLEAISHFVNNEDDICVPLAKIGDMTISLDGHTRMFYGITKGFSKVKGFYTKYDSYIQEFVKEARKRKILTPYDLQLLSKEQYELQWNKYCDDFFKTTCD